ncbi:MAG: TetR/AcrR family transcriptional regulator [Bacteroidia bacterium]
MPATPLSERQFEIIAAAGRILSASGVSGLTIKRLAQEMHFTEGAIYRHFASKEDIVLAMLAYLAEDMDQRLSRIVAAAQAPPATLEATFADQFAFFARHPHFVVAVFSDGLMAESRRINAAILRILQIKTKHLLPVIEQGQRQGFFTTDLPPEALAHIVMGTIRLQMLRWRIENFAFDIEQQGQQMLQAVSSLITRQPPL